MKKKVLIGALAVSFLSSAIYADALKNSLTNLMHTKEKSSVVDLGNINLNAKSKPKIPKIRHHKRSAIVGMVHGHKIIKKDADSYLTRRTQGKIKDYDMLPPQQQNRLIHEMAFPLLVLDAATKELSAEEIQNAYNRAWMQKEARNIQIKDSEAKQVYEEIKQQAEENNSTQSIPPFEAIKDRLKSQMLEKRLIGTLMQNVHIEVAP